MSIKEDHNFTYTIWQTFLFEVKKTSVLGMTELDALRFLGKNNTGFVINVYAVNQNVFLKKYLQNTVILNYE